MSTSLPKAPIDQALLFTSSLQMRLQQFRSSDGATVSVEDLERIASCVVAAVQAIKNPPASRKSTTFVGTPAQQEALSRIDRSHPSYGPVGKYPERLVPESLKGVFNELRKLRIVVFVPGSNSLSGYWART